MAYSRVYENKLFQKVAGCTIRPGGLALTKRAVEFCGFSSGDSILDIGCGNGATVEFLTDQYGLNCQGLEPSEILLNQGIQRNPSLTLIEGQGEEIPFADHVFQGVFAECSFSLIKDKEMALSEVARVLKPGGKFIVSDMYIRNGQPQNLSHDIITTNCALNAFLLNELQTLLKNQGFHILLLEDCTDYLKELMVSIIMEYGSIKYFWQMVTGNEVDCEQLCPQTRDLKLGYFLLVAENSKQL